MIYEIIRSRDLNAQFANDSSTSMEQLLVTTFAFRFRTGSLILTDKQRNHWKQSHQPCIWPIVSSLSSRSIPETKIHKKNTFERGKRRPVETHQWINQSVSQLASLTITFNLSAKPHTTVYSIHHTAQTYDILGLALIKCKDSSNQPYLPE